jgi:photosystem II stability/assembly factor-like uncharacterized protein
MRAGYGRAVVGVGAVALLAAGCTTNGGTRTPVLAGSTSPAIADGASAAAGGTGAVGAAGGPVPAGFRATDLTFVSRDAGWLLGTAPCSSAPCTSVVRTTDGGQSWIGMPAPRANLDGTGATACDSGHLCVHGLRFANSTTGYAFGSTALYRTTNGGAGWERLSGQADALEIGDGTVIRVGHAGTGCPPGCTYQISTTPIGGADWHPVSAPTVTGNNVQLLRTGRYAYLTVFQNPAGGAENAHPTLLTSADGGAHWTRRDDPCGTYRGNEADADRMAVAEDGSLTILCRIRGNGPDLVVTSPAGGAAFSAPHPLPASHTTDAVGAASASIIVAAVLPAGGTGTTATLYRSSDAGVHWAKVATAPSPAQNAGAEGVIGFQNASTGRWTTGSGVVLTTTDAGATWSTHTFSSR